MQTRTKTLVLTLCALVAWLVLSWFVPGWLHLRPSDVWLLRIALALLGLAGAGLFLWFALRRSGVPRSSSPAAKDVDLTFAQAAIRLKSASFAETRIGEFPAILLLGDTGSAKTTILQNSGLNPELLAGPGLGTGESVAPTSGLNLWLARGSVVIDPGASVASDRAAFSRVSAHLAPAVTASLANRPAQPRAAVLCLSCEVFTQPQAADLLTAKARQFREQLADLASALGVALPVYVLFTKLDSVPHFSEYVANLSNEEAQDVLGATLPFVPPSAARPGDSQALSDALTNLFPVLSERRLIYLAREFDQIKSAALYEFPREFQKLRPALAAFLTELSRPLQLQLNPILRGFYFTGVRPVLVHENAPARAPAPRRPISNDATGMFVSPPMAEQFSQPKYGSRRVPQWVHLGRLFPEVILADRSALDSSRRNVKSSAVQRIALVAASLAGIALAAAWTVSFISNYRLVSEARQASAAAATIRDLQPGLDVLSTLNRYQTSIVPLHMRWGLYTGNALYEPAFQAWYANFRRLLLAPTQEHLVQTLSGSRRLTAADYPALYNALKAYLITTEDAGKHTANFPLCSILQSAWQNGAKLPDTDVAAATANFSFYSDLLRRIRPWPYGTQADGTAVSTARSFLNNLSGIEPLYMQILSQPDGSNRPLIFNQLYPGTDRFIVNNYPVPAAFTKPGWAVAQTNIQKVSDYLKGEEWVLGPGAFSNVNKTGLQNDLQTRYRSDYARHWREYLRRINVVRFTSINDAAAKLSTLAGNQSPLLLSLCLASENTSVDPALQDLFEPVRQIVPPGCNAHLSSPSDDPYIQALIGLQASLTALSTDVSNDGLRTNTLQKATDAEAVVNQAASKFTVDKDHVIDVQTHKILEAPITYAQPLISGSPNGAAQAFCAQFTPLMHKYPFNPSAKDEATFKEVGDILAPNQGAFWKFYTDSLQKYLLLSGTSFSPKPGAPSLPTPAFVSFMNRTAQLSDELYHGGSDLKLTFDLRVIPDESLQSLTLTINGQVLTYSPSKSTSQHFTWPGAGAQEVKLQVRFTGNDLGGSTSGPWDIFQFFEDSESWQLQDNEYTMEKPFRLGAQPLIISATGRPAKVRFGLRTGTANPLLRPGALGGIPCVSQTVRQ